MENLGLFDKSKTHCVARRRPRTQQHSSSWTVFPLHECSETARERDAFGAFIKSVRPRTPTIDQAHHFRPGVAHAKTDGVSCLLQEFE